VRATHRVVAGRDDELRALGRMIEGALPAAVVVAGEAGIGKTTIWEAGLDRARASSYRVLQCRCAGSEAQLSFAAIADLLEPVLDDLLPKLPIPQRHALAVALLLEDPDGPPPDPRTIAAAGLGALRLLAREAPLLVAIDDAQWLDASSRSVLEFVVRRLADDRIALLVTVRGRPSPTPLGLDRALADGQLLQIVLGPLSISALHLLLEERLASPLSLPLLRSVHEASGGNPFFALEIAGSLERNEIRPKPAEPLPVPKNLQELVQARIAALPSRTQDVLLAAAALRRPTLALVWRAVEQHSDALDAAVEADVLVADEEELRFTHPLLAAAAYSSAPAARRREMHRRLAELVEEPEEQARHQALATVDADAAVAAVLDVAAQRAAVRGAPAAAAELYELAVRMTPPDEASGALERRLNAARHHIVAGAVAQAGEAIKRALSDAPPGDVRAGALLMLATTIEDDYEANVRYAEEALAEARDARLRAAVHSHLADALLYLNDRRGALEHARTALTIAESSAEPVQLADALARVALLELSIGPTTPGLLERALELERELDAGPAADPASGLTPNARSPSLANATRLLYEGRLDEAREWFAAVDRKLAAQGDVFVRPFIFWSRTQVECAAGELDGAERYASMGYELAQQLGLLQTELSLLTARAEVAALRGRVADARAWAGEALAAAAAIHDAVFAVKTREVLGSLELSIGNPAAAAEHLRAAVALAHPRAAVHLLPDAVEAEIELGELDQARRLLAQLEELTLLFDTPRNRALCARSRALLIGAEGNLAASVRTLEEASFLHQDLPEPLERGRALLRLGVAQRRAKRKSDARESLQRALAEFERIGATVWAERARAELARISGRAPIPGGLTPAELRVAELVAAGLTNRETAGRLFVTVSTVETHLSHVYDKLGVRSRTELARRVGSAES
jgi:ATP/maltotriose-dependent transcriptional regulator MalT